MKKNILRCALLLGLSPFLVQCVATEQDLRGLEMRTRTMDSRITDLENLNETIRGQATSQARMGNELENISNRLLQHEGWMEESEHRHRQLRDEHQETQRALNMRLDNVDISLKEITDQMEEKEQKQARSLEELHNLLADLEARQERNQRQIRELREQIAQEAAKRAEEAREAAAKARREAEERARRQTEQLEQRETATAGNDTIREITADKFKEKVAAGQISIAEAVPEDQPETVPEEPETTTAPAIDDDDYYSRGARHLEQSEYQEAYTAFARYLEETPQGDNAADARYLLGESLYGQQEYELAILEYQKVIADFSGHDRAPAALLRQGMAFEELREPSTAAIVYQRLIDEFPDSNQAGEARALLEEIN